MGNGINKCVALFVATIAIVIIMPRFFLSHAACTGLILTLALFVFVAPAFALPDELEVRLDEMTHPGELGLDMIVSHVPTKSRPHSDEALRPAQRLLQVSPDFSWGLTQSTQLNVQLFSSFAPGAEARLDGGRVEFIAAPVRPADRHDGYWLGGLLEIGHLPRTLSINRLDAEIKFFLGMRRGRWTLAANPEIGFKVAGSGSGQPELGLKLKIARQMGAGYHAGIEHYGDLGELRRIGPLAENSQLTFAVVDFKMKAWDFNIGVGRGWNSFSERWVLKTIIGFPFGR